jgi:WD40 repeat protein
LIRLSESAEGMQQTHKCSLSVKAIDLTADDDNLYVLNM